jgi:hypothetical protein
MQCSACKEEISDGAKQCENCGTLLVKTDQKKGVQETAQPIWWKYSVFADKSIERIDQILFFVYIGFAFYIPISAIISLILIHVVRKKNVNDVYRKAGTVVLVGVALFSMIASYVRTMNK